MSYADGTIDTLSISDSESISKVLSLGFTYSCWLAGNCWDSFSFSILGEHPTRAHRTPYQLGKSVFSCVSSFFGMNARDIVMCCSADFFNQDHLCINFKKELVLLLWCPSARSAHLQEGTPVLVKERQDTHYHTHIDREKERSWGWYLFLNLVRALSFSRPLQHSARHCNTIQHVCVAVPTTVAVLALSCTFCLCCMCVCVCAFLSMLCLGCCVQPKCHHGSTHCVLFAVKASGWGREWSFKILS